METKEENFKSIESCKIKLCKNKNTKEFIYKDYNIYNNKNMIIMGDDKHSFTINFIKELININSSLYIENKNFSIYNNIKSELENKRYEVKIINLINNNLIIEDFNRILKKTEDYNSYNPFNEILKLNLGIQDKSKILYLINYDDSININIISYIRNLVIKEFYEIADKNSIRKDIGSIKLQNNLNIILDLNIPSKNIDKLVKMNKLKNIDFTLYFEKKETLSFEKNELKFIVDVCDIMACLNKHWYSDEIIDDIICKFTNNMSFNINRNNESKFILINNRLEFIEIEEL